MDEHRPGFKSETCSKKMIKFDNFSKIEIFKFGSNFQVEIHKESNKSKKKFPLPLGLPLPLTPHLAAEGGAEAFFLGRRRRVMDPAQ